MLNTARRKKLLIALAILAASAVIVLTAYRVRHVVLFARLPPTERRVVGTWREVCIDCHDYRIVRPDHSYAVVGSLDFSPTDDPIVLCTGHWRIEGDDIVLDCTTAVTPGLEKEFPPKTYSRREPIRAFLESLEPHAPVSYRHL
jgi:hypothetical protein